MKTILKINFITAVALGFALLSNQGCNSKQQANCIELNNNCELNNALDFYSCVKNDQNLFPEWIKDLQNDYPDKKHTQLNEKYLHKIVIRYTSNQSLYVSQEPVYLLIAYSKWVDHGDFRSPVTIDYALHTCDGNLVATGKNATDMVLGYESFEFMR